MTSTSIYKDPSFVGPLRESDTKRIDRNSKVTPSMGRSEKIKIKKTIELCLGIKIMETKALTLELVDPMSPSDG